VLRGRRVGVEGDLLRPFGPLSSFELERAELRKSPDPTALPSRPKISARLDAFGAIVPPAAATSGSARTRASSDSGTVAAPL
jgi:hypothetical protein